MTSRYDHFRALHAGPGAFILPNAWDVVSAKVFARGQFLTIGTTSAGIAASLGYPDGEQMPWSLMLATVARIARSVTVPVSADCEGGYLRQITPVQLVNGLQRAGICGLNLEDGSGPQATPLRPVVDQSHLLADVRRYSDHSSAPLWVNARIDAYWHDIGGPDVCFQETLQRARAYRDAGADSIFVPGVEDPTTIAQLVAEVDLPLNVLMGPSSPPIPELGALGVRRVSLGSGPFRATAALTIRLARDLQVVGASDLLHATLRYEDLMTLFTDGERVPLGREGVRNTDV